MSADHKMADGTERLAKRVAVQQSCSRADAERYIEGGWIAVDGQVVEEPGFRVGASQTVSLLPGARLETLRPVTILVHKPVGVYANDEPGSARDLIVPANRMEGDRSPQRYLKRLLAGLRLVTPLERAASGLVVYTQEYPVARKLQEEARLVEQEYIAEVSGSLDAEGLGCAGACRRPAGLADAGQLAERNPAAFRAQDARAGLHRVRLRRRRTGTAGLAPHPHRRLPLAGCPPANGARADYERF